MPTTRPKHICQYWNTKEPVQCTHWDNTNTYCTFEEEITDTNGIITTKKAPLYPLCNGIGTAQYRCNQYSGSGFSPRCVIPDATKATPQFENCTWTTITGTIDTSDGGPSHTPMIDYSRINEYNYGACNSNVATSTAGANPKCRGYSPQHMGFSRRAPICEDTPTPTSYPTTPRDTEVTGITRETPPFYLPTTYNILNLRAQLGKCFYWQGDDTGFIVDNTGIVVAPTFQCTHASTAIYNDYSLDENLAAYLPPCNGAKPECPYYSGNMISPSNGKTYLSDSYLRKGDKILAEQILELRYNIRRKAWTKEDFYDTFKDAEIYAFTGERPQVRYADDGSLQGYTLNSTRTYIDPDTFESNCYSIIKENVPLTAGNASNNTRSDYPTLIRELKDIYTQPVIETEFEKGVFETSMSDHKVLKIYGTCSSNNSNIIAINISDPELSFPFPDIKENDSIYKIKRVRGESIYDALVEALDCYMGFLTEYGQAKVFTNTFSEDNRAFSLDVETFFGKNEIVVFDGSNNWAYDKIKVEKIFCNGVIAQTSFLVESTTETTSPENQENNLSSRNPEIKFEYKPLQVSSRGVSSIIDHFYMDTKITVLASNPLSPPVATEVGIGYIYYKVTAVESLTLTGCDLLVLGTDGRILITVPDEDKKLHCIIKSWETSEAIMLNGVDAFGNSHNVEMKIEEYCTDNLEINQAIIKPANFNNYRRLYNPFIYIKKIYVYERRSFGEEPEGTFEIVPLNNESVNYSVYDVSIEGSPQSEVTMTKVPTAPIVMSAVFRGAITGRIKGQMKSDLIVWSKSAYCSDVEIYYRWTANYNNVKLLPEHYKYANSIGTSAVGTTPHSYAPHCGDHYFGFWDDDQTRKPMWYPYEQCNFPASYEIFDGSGEYDEFPMEIFTGARQDPHGSEDIRMLGPATSFGVTSDVHTHIWNCTYDYTHNNHTQIGDAWFSGYGRIRTGIDGEELALLTRNGGVSPKFGNKFRDIYSSFRSSAALYYYDVTNEGGFSRNLKWMPKVETFSLTTFDRSFKEYPFEHYFNTDDKVCNYLDQFGNFIVNGSIDNVGIDEYVLDGKYKFKEIFRPHSTQYGIVYPQPTRLYEAGTSLPKPVGPWYTYKDPPIGTGAIQWAWRTTWTELNRPSRDITSIMANFSLENCDSNQTEHLDNHLGFLQLFYPNYTYDSKAEEKTRVCDENSYTIYWEPCSRPTSVDGEAQQMDWYFILRMDNGPIVLFDQALNVVTDDTIISDTWGEIQYFDSVSNEELIEHVKFFNICSGSEWLSDVIAATDLETVDNVSAANDVMLYTTNTVITTDEEVAKTNAEDDERIVDYYDSGLRKVFYYNRGLVARLNTSEIKYIPKEYTESTAALEFSLSRQSNDETDFSVITVDEFYAVLYNFGATYSAASGTEVNLIYKFSGAVIGKLDISFSVGADIITNPEEVDLIQGLYHVPEVTVSISTDGVGYIDVGTIPFEFYGSESGSFNVVSKSLELDLDLDYMSTYITHLKLNIRYKPTSNEAIEGEFNYPHFMKLLNVKLYDIYYISGEEYVDTYERKYKVSVGNYANFPVHGYDSTGSLLYPVAESLSTVYHVDTRAGILGMEGTDTGYSSISKLRGRHCGDTKEDKILIAGTYSDMEKKQKELYDAVVDTGDDMITFKSIIKDIMLDVISNTGVTQMPEWDCILINRAMGKLSEVTPQNYYNPAGHYWNWDVCNFYEMSPCGSRRTTEVVFDYIWQRVGAGCGQGWPSISPFILYGQVPASVQRAVLENF